jgi:hypothetical protein
MAYAFKFARVELALKVMWDGECRLLMQPRHDPHSMAVWAFSPFRSILVSDDHAAWLHHRAGASNQWPPMPDRSPEC